MAISWQTGMIIWVTKPEGFLVAFVGGDGVEIPKVLGLTYPKSRW